MAGSWDFREVKAHGRVVTRLIDDAVRNGSGWTPVGPSDGGVSRVVTFADAARLVGYADPSEIDDYLRQGSSAFLGKNYRWPCAPRNTSYPCT